LLGSGLALVVPGPASALPAAKSAVGDPPEGSVPGPGVAAAQPGPDPDMAVNLAGAPNAPAPVAPAAGSSTEEVLTPVAADAAAKTTDPFVLEVVADPSQPVATSSPSATSSPAPAGIQGGRDSG
jgi:hypothetical protein